MVIKKDANGNVIVISADGTQTLYPNTDEGGDGAAMAALEQLRSELGAAAYQAVANNLTRVNAGAVLDARQGKVLADMIASRIQVGTTVIARQSGDNTVNITFDPPFASAPVLVAIYSTSDPDRFRAHTVSRTASGGTIGLYNSGAGAGETNISWVALL